MRKSNSLPALMFVVIVVLGLALAYGPPRRLITMRARGSSS